MVMACSIPACGLSGATTTTSPNSIIYRINALRPGAVIPSSFVTRIKGFAIVYNLCCKNTFLIYYRFLNWEGDIPKFYIEFMEMTISFQWTHPEFEYLRRVQYMPVSLAIGILTKD